MPRAVRAGHRLPRCRQLGIGATAAVFDISNACLGVLNGILEVANRIELGQIRAGLVVSCESAREINDIMIARMLDDRSMEKFANSLATLTGGSGAAAVLLTDGSFSVLQKAPLRGGMTLAAPEHHGLCLWGMTPDGNGSFTQSMSTDAVNVMNYGVDLGRRTWEEFLPRGRVAARPGGSSRLSPGGARAPDDHPADPRHPPGEGLHHLRIPRQHGTVSLPLTAALADEREMLSAGDRVGFLGIGSGFNCLMLGVEW